MKRSASEVTEKVTFVADNYVERGPFNENISSSAQELALPMPSFIKLKNRVHIFPICLEYMLSTN